MTAFNKTIGNIKPKAKDFLLKIRTKIPKYSIHYVLYKLLLSWLLISIFYIANSDISFTDFYYFEQIKLSVFICAVAVLWLILCKVQNIKFINVLMILTALVYGTLAATKYSDFSFSVGCCIAAALLILHTDIKAINIKIHRSAVWIVCVILIGGFSAFVGIICCMYYKNYWTSCFDFGLFAQMFHYMKEIGLPFITCERDGLLSHFAVHFSPIFYLLLPIYILVPSPCTLLILQAFVVASGAIPLMLICKNHKLTNWSAILFCVCYILYPCFAGSCFTYIHENNFLAPLILWFIFFAEQKKNIPTFVFAVLVLLVKEDAAVYVAVISLYFLFTQKNYKCNFSLLIISVIYFIVVTHFLKKYGDGVMTGRYSNYMYDGEDSFMTMIESLIQNPVYAVQQSFTQEKLIFILQMLLPLGFLPVITKCPKRLILLIPFLLINLMTNYQWQYNIGFQYGFGSGSLLIYLAVLNYSCLKDGRKWLLISACSSVIIFFGLYYNRTNYFETYENATEQRQTIDYALSLIPEDASVVSSTFILPNLSQRDEVYELERTNQTADYYVLDLRYTTDEFDVSDYLNDAYDVVYYKEDTIGVFKRNSLYKP